MSGEAVWSELEAGNRRFVAGQPLRREYLRRRRELAGGQHPRVIVLTCADSRVSPELLFDQSLGDLFVVRTAGIVAHPVALGSFEYAGVEANVHRSASDVAASSALLSRMVGKGDLTMVKAVYDLATG